MTDGRPTPEDLPTDFTDKDGKQWTIKISIPVLRKFCKENKITFNYLAKNAQDLDIGQLLEIIYAGTRWNSKALDKHVEMDDWLECLEGPAFSKALICAGYALTNFFLKCLPKAKREEVKTETLEAQAAADHGQTPLSSEPAVAPESVPTPQP